MESLHGTQAAVRSSTTSSSCEHVLRLTRPDMTPEEAARHVRHGVPQNVDLSDEAMEAARLAAEERDRAAVLRATQAYVAAVDGWVSGCDEREFPAASAARDREIAKFPPGLSPFGDDPRPRVPAPVASAPQAVRARAAAMCAEVERGGGRGLWLFGPAGSGKTTLAALLLQRWRADGWDGDMVTEAGYLAAVKAEFDGAAPRGSALDRYGGTALLVLDDLGTSKPTDWSVAEVFGLVDARWSHGLPTVVTGNHAPERLRERLAQGDQERAAAIVSRLAGMCRVVSLGGADHRQDWRRAS